PAATAAAATPGASAARTAAASAAPGAAATPPPGASAGSPAAAGASAGAFDLDLGGQNALSAARACIAADRRVQFGASLLFDPKTGLSRKVYFGAGQLEPGERRCLSKALTGIAAGGPPARPTVITYAFTVHPGGGEVKGRPAP